MNQARFEAQDWQRSQYASGIIETIGAGFGIVCISRLTLRFGLTEFTQDCWESISVDETIALLPEWQLVCDSEPYFEIKSSTQTRAFRRTVGKFVPGFRQRICEIA